jgi:hypothetical protein
MRGYESGPRRRPQPDRDPALTGCDNDSPIETVTIFVGGQCRVVANTIVCRDASRSEPANRLTVVDWELISSSTGLSQGVLPSAPGGEISFTGLVAGSYQVNQTVSAQDGSTQGRSYGPFTISSNWEIGTSDGGLANAEQAHLLR